jgi:hypothetical protein
MEEPGGNAEFRDFYLKTAEGGSVAHDAAHVRMMENCLAMGSPKRPDGKSGTVYNDWYGKNGQPAADRCRVLFAMNMVGAGRGTTMLWETNPPIIHAEGPEPWISEQETAATHLQRNLQEINAMCATGQIAARVQILVCEPISPKWTEWMDSQLVDCGGKPWPKDRKFVDTVKVEERPSPVQVVVSASAATADTCHNLKSGFMEKRIQDMLLANPMPGKKDNDKLDPSIKGTNPDLISSDDHDVYVGMKWSSLVTIRAVHSFLQASADIAAAASSPVNDKPLSSEKTSDGSTVSLSDTLPSPFLIPSFVRVAYVSEENSKVAKWRMHGDFFHPSAWEICKDSFDVSWIPHSLSGGGGVNGICDSEAVARKLTEGQDCGQWWVYFAELQMPIAPEVFASEASPPIVQGGSNFFWMVTERQRREVVSGIMCRDEKTEEECPEVPQAVMPLGDLESFLINYTPNTALGKKHIGGRRPGYSKEDERKEDRKRVKERKQLHDQEEIEKALFDYTIYPAALFHKDATIKAARTRDVVLTKNRPADAVGPQTIKSSYYDVTITKPREPVLGWCQAIARNGLCTLYADYFRTSNDKRCMEACGLKKDWTPIN